MNASIPMPSRRVPAALDAEVVARADACLDAAGVAAFRADGAIHLKGLLDADDIARLADGIERNLADPSPRAIVASRPDDPGRFIEDFCNWTRIDAYRRLIEAGPLARVARRLTGSRTIRFHHDHLLVKEPGTRQRTPWHQDQPYYDIDGFQNVSFWIPVDPVSRAATLEFVAGSHRGPWLMPRSFLDQQAKWFPEGSLADLPDIEAARDRHRIIGWATEPGDVVAFHMLTLHASAGVDGPSRRRVFSARFIGDDVRHAPRRWATSPQFPGLAQVLPAGAPMAHPWFPELPTGPE